MHTLWYHIHHLWAWLLGGSASSIFVITAMQSIFGDDNNGDPERCWDEEDDDW